MSPPRLINKRIRNFKTTTSYYRKVKTLNRRENGVKKSDIANEPVKPKFRKSIIVPANADLRKIFIKKVVSSVPDKKEDLDNKNAASEAQDIYTKSPELRINHTPNDSELNSFNQCNFTGGCYANIKNDDLPKTIFGEPPNTIYDEFDTNNDEAEEDELDSKVFFLEEMRNWALTYKMSNRSTNALLTLLRSQKNFDYLPRDCRTLLKTPKSVNVLPMGVGHYWHNGLSNSLQDMFADLNKNLTISLLINIDGLPLHRSTKTEFWPILFMISEFPKKGVGVIGIYCGEKKANLTEFLSYFVEEAKDVIENGIKIKDHLLKVKIKCFVCDTPARTYIKGTINFNGYSSCGKCTTMGEYFNETHRMSFPNINCILRTDSSFREQKDTDHHKQTTPLTELPINLIEDFPVADSLHLLDLGLMKRLITGWVTGQYNFKTKLSAQLIKQISTALVNSNKRRPSEIHRSIRSLDVFKFWKGVEFRTILLYVGPVIFKDILPDDVYVHFLMLNCATTICSCKSYLSWTPIANQLFRDFVEDFNVLYGKDTISSNVHNLCHVVNDVNKFGPLVSFSSYPFENYLYQIKQLLRGGSLPLSQIAKRITELSCINTDDNLNFENKYPSVAGSKRTLAGHFLKIQIAEQFMLSHDNRNKWFLTNNQEIVGMNHVEYSEGTFFINGSPLSSKNDFFTIPFCSSRLNIYISNEHEKDTASLYKINEIKCKLFGIDYKNSTVFMPLLHTLDSNL